MTEDGDQPRRPEPLGEDSLRNEKQERFLRKLLRGVFAVHAALTLSFFVLGALGMFVPPSVQMSVSLSNGRRMTAAKSHRRDPFHSSQCVIA